MFTTIFTTLCTVALGFPLVRFLFVKKPKYIQGTAGQVRKPFGIDQYAEVVGELRASFNAGVTRPYEWRVQQLLGLKKLVEDNYDALREAMYKDNKKTDGEWFLESKTIIGELDIMVDCLHTWMKPEYFSTPLWMQPASSYVQREAYGTVLVISPFNYPASLSILPVAAAISAGNCAVVKFSELAPHQSTLLATLIPQYVDNACVATVEGAIDEAKALLNVKWDKIFFTGGTAVGRLIEKQVAGTLTPVSLELGGKSPVIVDRTANMAVAARRIVQGRFVNSGQTCIAPDYVLVVAEAEKALLEALKQCVIEFFGADPQQSADFARMIAPHHFRRVAGMIRSGGSDDPTVYHGGQTDEADCYIAPTILTNVKPESAVMSEEIFGPLLPVLPVASVEAAVAFINARPKPLALYVFTEKSAVADSVLACTSAGGSCVNDTVFQYVNSYLPFGGVGESGIGAYHGKHGFEEFSHRRGVMRRSTFGDLLLRYPPFTPLAKKVFGFLM